jgi:xylulokinase
LSWRLRGFGPADESPLGPVLEELATDRSDASGTSYWNPATGDYDRELLTASLGHDAVLPRIVAPGGSMGTTVAQPHVPAGILVGPGAGDNAAAALGLGAREGDVVVSIGTSGTVFAVTDKPVADETGAVAGFADASGAFLPLVATLNAARVLDRTAALLGVDHAGLGELALAAEPGSGGLVLQPYFEGERTPNLPDATATLFGMTLASTTRENLARAAIEGMLCGLADGLDAVRRLGVTASRVLLVGGAAANPAVSHIAAQVFDAPVELPEAGEYVAFGAAVQAAWALSGQRPNWQVATLARPTATPEPRIRVKYAANAAA